MFKVISFETEKAVASYADAWIEIPSERHVLDDPIVASYADAWIEILGTLPRSPGLSPVASYADAWIEINLLRIVRGYHSVASYADAWIEIGGPPRRLVSLLKSHPTRMRGLI